MESNLIKETEKPIWRRDDLNLTVFTGSNYQNTARTTTTKPQSAQMLEKLR